MTNGKLDKMVRRVEKLLEKKVPFSLWTRGELNVYAYEFTGFGCTACGGTKRED